MIESELPRTVFEARIGADLEVDATPDTSSRAVPRVRPANIRRCLLLPTEAIAARFEAFTPQRQADALPAVIETVYAEDPGSVDPTHPATGAILGVLFLPEVDEAGGGNSLADFQDALIAAEYAVLNHGLAPLVEVVGCDWPVVADWRLIVANNMPILLDDAPVSARLPFLHRLAALATIVPVREPEAIALQALRDIVADTMYDNAFVAEQATELVDYLHERHLGQGNIPTVLREVG